MPGTEHSSGRETQDSEKQSSYVLKILVLGVTGVGRRSLIRRFIGYDFYEKGYYRLTGTSFGVCQLEFGDSIIALQLWMLGCEPWFQSLRESHYRGRVGAIFAFSVTSRASFESIPGLAKEILRSQGLIPTVLIGSKVDLAEERVVSSEEGQALAEQLGAHFIETSTTDDRKILAVFQYLVEDIIKPQGPRRTLVRIPLATAPQQEAPPYREKTLPTKVTEPSSEDELVSLSEASLSQEEFDERVTRMLEQLGREEGDLMYDYLRSLSAAGHRETVIHRLQSLQEEKTLKPERPPLIEEKMQAGVIESIRGTDTRLEELDDGEVASLSREEFDELVTQALKRLGLEKDQVMHEYLRSLSAAGHREVVLLKLRTL